MASSRVGLKQLPNACNSPSIFQSKKFLPKQALSPLKSRNENSANQYRAKDEDKENRGTQATVQVKATAAQTEVAAVADAAPLTKDDLLCEEPTSSYWRGLAEKFEKEIDIELETSFNKSLELDKSYEELTESRNRLEILLDVMDDVLKEEVNNEQEEDKESDIVGRVE